MGCPSDRAAPVITKSIIFCSLICLRYLVILSFGDDLQQRVELSNAFNGFRGVKEASALLYYGVSPYSGSGVRVPPLAIMTMQPLVGRWWAPGPFILADVLCACLIFLISRHLTGSLTQSTVKRKTATVVTPTAAACIYLCNPLTILTCSSLSLAGLSQAALMVALYGAAVPCSPAITALGVALASYLDIYSSIFCLPLVSILVAGVESIHEQSCSCCLDRANAPSDVTAKLHQRQCRHCNGSTEPEVPETTSFVSPYHPRVKLCEFLGVLLLCALALVFWSDVTVLTWPGGRCLEWLQVKSANPTLLIDHPGHESDRNNAAVEHFEQGLCSVETTTADYMRLLWASRAMSAHGSGVTSTAGDISWMVKSYGGSIMYDDPSPNIGVWWCFPYLLDDVFAVAQSAVYFIGEMFHEFKAFFKFVLHSQALIFSIPIAVRFCHRPLFAFFLHAMLMAIFKPFPVAADVALYLNLLSILLPTLGWSQPGIMLGFVMQVAAIMGPATLYQWLHTGSANSNFFYAMTLVWAGAQVLLMLLITYAVQQHDVDISGKAQLFKLPCKDVATQSKTAVGREGR